ncbi:NUDIX domain-containing protein [Streptomyces sp. SAI-218]|uniref:NUDIX domain-containing protein n=1 Tax=Streptomyces sp. SAI-218 TaxID=3377736 RepID=UPI003C7A26E5
MTDGRGNSLISLTRGREAAPPQDAPLPAALVALWRAGRVLMVFDRYRRTWELPGGSIEEGESPRQAVDASCWRRAGSSLTNR